MCLGMGRAMLVGMSYHTIENAISECRRRAAQFDIVIFERGRVMVCITLECELDAAQRLAMKLRRDRVPGDGSRCLIMFRSVVISARDSVNTSWYAPNDRLSSRDAKYLENRKIENARMPVANGI